ncbi:MAG TPA: AAA family ATPase [Pseudomonadota bacterium]|nr:AAA family ATPase [Pseudomonadota bacterium]
MAHTKEPPPGAGTTAGGGGGSGGGDELLGLRDAVAALPQNLPLRRQLAEALFRGGHIEEALQVAQKAHVTDAKLMLLAARCLYEVGRYREGLEQYDKAVALELGLADAVLRDKLARATADPRSRLRVVADPEREADAAASDVEVEQPQITFADVGGLDDLKEKIRLRVLHPLKRPDLYKAFGKKVGGGILMYGPPGCGKTFLARATAGEAGVRFLAVGIDDVLDMWFGQSEKKLHALFQAARQQSPTILFFDEVDALGGRRSASRHDSYRMLVAQFLADMDGVGSGGAQSQKDGVLVMGATNAPWDVDPAFRRPGRFSDTLFVPPPDLRARVEILKLKLKGKPTQDLDVTELGRATELYSGADLEQIVESATEAALMQSMKSGAVRPLTMADLLAAHKRVRPSTLEWFSTARNFATYANEAGQYNDVLDYIKRHRLG